MRPRVHCASCNATLAWGQEVCPSCGTAVDWPGVSGSHERKRASGAQSSNSPGIPARNIAILVGIIAIGVVLLEVLTGPKNVPESAVAPAAVAPTATTGADMSAVPRIQDLESRSKANPKDQEVRRDLGNQLMDARFYDRAITVYKEYLGMTPKDANVRVDLGICYKELGQLDAAIREMKAALKDEPRHLNANYNLGVVYLAQGDLAEANRWFKATVALDPTSEVGKKAQQLLQQHSSLSTP